MQAVNAVVRFCVGSVLAAVAFNFASARGKGDVHRETRSTVATASMLGFFVLIYSLIKFHIGSLTTISPHFSVVFGLTLMIMGAAVNLLGRIALARNWGNQIRIYNDHELIRSGVYSIIRHPLYASLIWMFYGAAIIYSNWIVFLMNTMIFLPAMVYRANIEEEELSARFVDYAAYQHATGMFFPKFFNLEHLHV